MYEATVSRLGLHTDRHTKTILLTNIVGIDRDHVWVKQSKRLKGVKIGDRIRFSARVEEYLDSRTLKYDKIGFRHIRDVKIIERKRNGKN